MIDFESEDMGDVLKGQVIDVLIVVFDIVP